MNCKEQIEQKAREYKPKVLKYICDITYHTDAAVTKKMIVKNVGIPYDVVSVIIQDLKSEQQLQKVTCFSESGRFSGSAFIYNEELPRL